MEVEEVSIGRARPPVPYVPGLLGFREAPAAADALERLSAVPDAILVDGQGYAHPRRFGLACHIGRMTGLPTVGCAKSVLLGRHGPLGSERGDWALMRDRGETVGAAVRTRRNVSPVYVSVGHRVDLESAIALVLGCCGRYRLPETTRMAHHAAAGTLGEPAGAAQDGVTRHRAARGLRQSGLVR
jgi:deoxyribonuclease V